MMEDREKVEILRGALLAMVGVEDTPEQLETLKRTMKLFPDNEDVRCGIHGIQALLDTREEEDSNGKA